MDFVKVSGLFPIPVAVIAKGYIFIEMEMAFGRI